jgi:anti-anti-sigma regulatory factor
MTIRKRAVAVMQLPEQLSPKAGRICFSEIESRMSVDRPYLVLDCSNLHRLDKPVVHLLLRCLEEAMKRNGDVKLARIPPGTEGVAGSSGVNRLFEIFETTEDAVNSFHQLPFEVASETRIPDCSENDSEDAA